MMQKGRYWLIVTHPCNLDGRAASQHIDDRLPCLKREGITPIVISGPTGPRLADTLHVQTYSPAPSGLRFEIGYRLRTGKRGPSLFRLFGPALRILILPFYLMEKVIIDVESQWSWFLTAGMHGLSLCKKYDPEIVYSTGGPFSAHLAAAMVAGRCSKPWIAELQDPLVHGDWQRSKRALRMHAWVEKFICSRADAVVFVTDGARRGANERTGLGEKGWVVYPGAFPACAASEDYRKGSACRFAHFGTLAGLRNTDVFLEALEHLFRQHPDLYGSVKLDLYGNFDRRTLGRIESFPYRDVVTVHGRLSREESLRAMRKSDVLLLIQDKSDFSSETIPSKTYEYLQAGRPVLGLVYKNPELDAILAEHGHTAADASDALSVLKGIYRCLGQWQEEGTGKPARSPSPYTVEAAVRRLMEISMELIPRKASAGGAHG